MSLSERWRLLVTGEERIDKIIGIAELAYSVQPLYEVVRQAKKIESNIFEASNSKENYASTMDQLILSMKKLIEDKTKINLEQLATKSIQDSMDKRIKQIKEETEMKGRSINIDNNNYTINNESDEEDVKRIKEILQIEERLLKESWQKYIDEQMGRLHQQRQMHAARLRLSIQNMQLNQQQNVPSSPSPSSISSPTETPPSSSSSSSSSSYSSTSTPTSVTNHSNREIHSSSSSSKPPNSLSSIAPDASAISANI